MFRLFMPLTELSGVCRPSSIAPTAFNLVQMVGTIVEVITHAISSEGTATALWHGLLVPSTAGGGMQRLLRIVRTVYGCSKASIRYYTRGFHS